MHDYAFTPQTRAQQSAFEWGKLYWYTSAQQGNTDHLTVGRCVLNPGAENPRHYHPNCEEVLHVVSGKIEHFVQDHGWVTMQPGDTITISANVWHQARNGGDAPAHLLICFSSPDRQTVGE